jgi:hypothetical protein
MPNNLFFMCQNQRACSVQVLKVSPAISLGSFGTQGDSHGPPGGYPWSLWGARGPQPGPKDYLGVLANTQGLSQGHSG